MPPDDGARAPAGRKQIDWEAVEADFRCGAYSTRQLANKHGCDEALIRRRAKSQGWEKDLAEAVRRATEERLVRADIRTADAQARAPQIVSEASETRVAVVLRHRAAVWRDGQRLEKMAEKLDALMPGFSSLPDIMEAQGVLESMVRTRMRLIPLERQAFGLDDKSPADRDDRTPDQIQAALASKLKVLGVAV
jgi:hypothetical protein